MTVTLSEDDVTWRLEVLDDGVGVPDAIPERAGHRGVKGMRSRVEALGGACTIMRRPERGTRVLLEVPRSR